MAHSDTAGWDEASPANAEFFALGAKEIRLLRGAARVRLLKEHVEPAAAGVGGEHLAGSAVSFIDDYENDPDTNQTTRPDGATALDGDDAGRFLIDTNAAGLKIERLHYWDGSNWILFAERSMQGGVWQFSHLTDMNLILKNFEVAYTAGAKDITLRFRGMETTNECDLVHIEVSHEGAADDHKGQLSIKMNAGTDDLVPSKEAIRFKSTGKIDAANSLAILDQDGMDDDDDECVPTQQSVKAYIAAQIAAAIPSLGAWAVKADNTIYQAATDGFVCAEAANTGQDTDVLGITDSNSTPTTVRDRAGVSSLARGAGVSFPVKKDDYWKTENATNVYWIPFSV